MYQTSLETLCEQRAKTMMIAFSNTFALLIYCSVVMVLQLSFEMSSQFRPIGTVVGFPKCSFAYLSRLAVMRVK